MQHDNPAHRQALGARRANERTAQDFYHATAHQACDIRDLRQRQRNDRQDQMSRRTIAETAGRQPPQTDREQQDQ